MEITIILLFGIILTIGFRFKAPFLIIISGLLAIYMGFQVADDTFLMIIIIGIGLFLPVFAVVNMRN